MKRLFAILVLAVPTAAGAQPTGTPRTIEDCETIKGDLAYNQCLAQFGPRVGERPRTAALPPDDDGVPAARQRPRGGSPIARTRGGRYVATFEVMSGKPRPAVANPSPARTSRKRR